MTHYQAFIIGRDGLFVKAIDLVCENDDDAKKRARRIVDGHDVELWHHDRKVAKFEGHIQ